jgi:hypothetical protein
VAAPTPYTSKFAHFTPLHCLFWGIVQVAQFNSCLCYVLLG